MCLNAIQEGKRPIEANSGKQTTIRGETGRGAGWTFRRLRNGARLSWWTTPLQMHMKRSMKNGVTSKGRKAMRATIGKLSYKTLGIAFRRLLCPIPILKTLRERKAQAPRPPVNKQLVLLTSAIATASITY